MKPVEALDSILETYDAFYITNKYGDNGTHELEFAVLLEYIFTVNDKPDELALRAIAWIKDCYDCYYKENYKDDSDDTAFSYLRKFIMGVTE